MCAGQEIEKTQVFKKEGLKKQGLKEEGRRIEINSSIVPVIKQPIHKMMLMVVGGLRPVVLCDSAWWKQSNQKNRAATK